MKAFLLAGGLGTRMLPLTQNTPKCLLPIKGAPILQIWFALCRRYGIHEILINAHSHIDAMRSFIERNKGDLNVRVFEEPVLLGSAGTVLANRDWIIRERRFWVFYADVLTTADLNNMLAFHDSCKQSATIGVYEVPNPSRCGIVQIDEHGIVCDFVEKPILPKGNLAFSGLMLGTPELLKAIPDRYPVDFGFHVLPRLIDQMVAYRISDFVIDIGTPETYQVAQETWPAVSGTITTGAIRC